ncbi:MAG: sigma-70 family RNA polymerase sigma factor [Acidobacteria bacterium]|nr:sigma-70 family RNA polymerase sigma factor [Acidobacteriota bacterium]MBS1865948.1 sigma-70 family RNA polymerase sigma factor [Acidobacteriota bacterium]
MDLFSFDDDYVRRLREGDPATVDHFVAYFSQLLRIKLRSRWYSPDRIEDIQQETFARVFKALQTENGIRHPERIGAYVNSVCNFVIHEKNRDDFKNQTPDESQVDPPDKILDIEGLTIKAEIMDNVRGYIAALPQREQDVIRMIFFEEKEKDEVCRSLRVDRDYLRVLLHRAIEHLRKKL